MSSLTNHSNIILNCPHDIHVNFSSSLDNEREVKRLKTLFGHIPIYIASDDYYLPKESDITELDALRYNLPTHTTFEKDYITREYDNLIFHEFNGGEIIYNSETETSLRLIPKK